jgi:hypothetical protein
MIRYALLAALLGACGATTTTPAPTPSDGGPGGVYALEFPNGGLGFNYTVGAYFPDVLLLDQLCLAAASPYRAGACCYFPPGATLAGTAAQYSVGPIQFGDCGGAAPDGGCSSSGTKLATLNFAAASGSAPDQYPLATWSGAPSWNAGQDRLLAYAPGMGTANGIYLSALSPPWIGGLTIGQDGGPASNWAANVAVSRAKDLSVSWTIADAGATSPLPLQMRLVLSPVDGSGAQVGTIFCLAPDSQGSLAVPAALLGLFTANDTCSGSAANSSCYLARESQARDVAGNAIYVQTAVAPTGYGAYATFQTTFQ